MRTDQARSDQARSERAETTSDYVQVFIYRVPKKNHQAFAETEGKLAGIFKTHGITRSELFALTPAKIFRGFTSIAEAVSAGQDEEVWLELDTYKDQRDRDEVVARIGQDPAAGPLFGRVLELCAPGSKSLQADFTRLTL